MEKEVLDKRKQKALQTSIHEGAATGFSQSIGDTFITPFAVALKANVTHIGFISAISGLIAPLSQFFGSKLLENHPRKKTAIIFSLLQASIWFLLAILCFTYWKGLPQDQSIFFLILLYTLLVAFGGLEYPAWFSWMGDLVPENERGKYFGKRNRAIGAVSIAAVLIGSFILDAFKTKGLVLLGFSTLFIAAAIFRFIASYLLKKQYSPQLKLEKSYYFSFWQFIKRKDNFFKFSLAHAIFNFALMVASPFFAVYLLKELGYESNYVLYTIIIISSSFFYLLFTPLVGRFSDRYGNKKLFFISCLLFSLNPVLWIFIKAPVLLILIPQLIVGLANAAFVLAVNNFVYESIPPQRRALCVSYLSILTGIGIFIGSLLGSFLIKYWHPSSINPFIFVFAVSALLRFTISLLIVSKIKEVKKTLPLHPPHVHLAHTFKTIHAELEWVKKITK